METLDAWLEAEGLVPPVDAAAAIGDVARIRRLLIAAAQERRSVSYSELLGAIGLRFSRPKMRALCRTLDAIDRDGAASGEPGLAVLVVRESDRLPGQGWWSGVDRRLGYSGAWTGIEAARLIRRLQDQVYAFWQERDGTIRS